MADKKQISKLISYWLRHEPQDGNLVPDEYGWIAVNALLEALKKRKMSITIPELVELSKSFDKVRWQFSDDLTQIRATHGHSIPVVLKDAAIPPAILYHGTADDNLAAIAAQGLIAMNRQFVHLSADTEMAIFVAKRHGKAVLIEVNTQPLVDAGWLFYNTSERVWLTSGIPAQYLKFPQL